MSNKEKRNINVEWLVISCISKNNNINNVEEVAILTSSQLFSLSLSHSSTSGNAETASRCPHCRPLTIFFFFYSSVYTLTMHVCMLTHTYKRKEGREKERLKQQKKSFLLT
jgi:hypothetical protein